MTTTYFRLLDLPAELREQVLALAVHEDQIIKPKVYVPRDRWLLRLPAVSRTNRQLRSESLPLYFEHNVFLFEAESVWPLGCENCEPLTTAAGDLPCFRSWCLAAGIDNIGRIRDLIFAGHGTTCIGLRLGKGGKVELTAHRNVSSGLPCAGSSPRDREWKERFRETPVPEQVSAAVRKVRAAREAAFGLLPDDIVSLCQCIG